MRITLTHCHTQKKNAFSLFFMRGGGGGGGGGYRWGSEGGGTCHIFFYEEVSD